jgi:hypothetical protein
MIKKNFLHNRKLYLLSVILIIFFGSILRFYRFSQDGYWQDEWYSLYFSDPGLSDLELNYNLCHAPGLPNCENTPKLFFILLKKTFQIFGYYAEIGRLFIAIFSIGSIFLSLYLINFFTKNKNSIIFFLLLFNTNLFLIWEGQETRVQSLVLFFSLLNIIFFFHVINNFSKKNITLYLFSIIFAAFLSPVTICLFISELIFIFIKFFKEYKKIIIFLNIFFFSLIFYIFFNHEYLFNVIGTKQFSEIKFRFFFSFFFNTFFASRFLGGFLLVLLFFTSIRNINKIIINQKIQFLYIILMTSYALLLIKSYSHQLMVPRYIIFILPVIMILIILNIEHLNFSIKKNKNIKLFLLFTVGFFSTINLFYNIENRPIKKPNTNELISLIAESNIKAITSSNLLFGNYFKTHYFFKKKKLIFIKINELTYFDKSIWLVCANNMRADFSGVNLKDYKNIECTSKKLDLNMKISRRINLPDLQAQLYEPK